MSRRRPCLAVVAATALLLSGCGLVGGSAETPTAEQGAEAPATTEAPDPDRDPAQLVLDATEATLGLSSLTLESQADLDVQGSASSTLTEGSVDYEAGLFDLDREIGETTEIGVVADGTRAWIKNEGPDGSAFEDGATWLQGDVDDLVASQAFGPLQLLGSTLALRAAGDDPAAVTELDTATYDGVDCRVLTLTVPYADAVAAAGEDADVFTEALTLTGPARRSDLALEVAVGPDDVIRSYSLTIQSTADVTGGYEVTLTGVGEPVGPPLAPDPTDVASGPEASEQFAALVGV